MNAQALNHGPLLYRLLPGIFRTRDRTTTPDGNPGDLAQYLSACGELLDRIHLTLEQLRLDSFPDETQDDEPSQDWVLPYIAELLDLRLASEEAQGQREEIRRAVDWRQRKGTLGILTEIAALVGGLEVQIQEGWRRVALTPRINEPLFPGNGTTAASATAPVHATVDVRQDSRAIALDPSDPENQNDPSTAYGRFSGEEILYRSSHPQGVPRFPGTYQDISRRTVDVRTPDPTTSAGRIHPGRVLLFNAAPPAPGTPRYHTLLHRLKDFLPVGIEVLLVADATLPNPPPTFAATRAITTGNGSAAAAPAEEQAVTEEQTTTP